MKRLVLRPLEKNFRVITERATSLEKFMACQYKYKFEPAWYAGSFEDIQKLCDTFEYWDILHALFQTYIMNPLLAEEQFAHIRKTGQLGQKDLDNLTKLYSQFKDRRPKWTEWDCVMYVEKKMKVAIEDGDILLILEWTADTIMRSWTTIDYKTSKTKWSSDSLLQKAQWYLYPWLYALYDPNSSYRFVYIVWDKAVRDPQLMMLESEMPKEESVELFKDVIKYYLESVRTETWEAEPAVLRMCNACKLKWLCPKFIPSEELF